MGARGVPQLEDNLKALELKHTEDDLKEIDAASKPEGGYPYSFIGARERW